MPNIMSAAPSSFREELAATAAAIVASGKGILAADESTGTIGKRFAGIGVENVEENRRAYRELLFTSGKGLAENIGGVILFEETLDQKTADGIPFTKILSDNGIIVGIKVDKVSCPFMILSNLVIRELLFCMELMKKPLRKVSMILARDVPRTTPKELVLQNGVASLKLDHRSRLSWPSMKMHMCSLVTLLFAKPTALFPLSSQRS